MARALSAVSDAPDPPPSSSGSVGMAAAGGDRRELLVAMRSRIATAIDDTGTPARDLAALTRRLADFAEDIEAIDTARKQEAHDAESTPDETWDGSTL